MSKNDYDGRENRTCTSSCSERAGNVVGRQISSNHISSDPKGTLSLIHIFLIDDWDGFLETAIKEKYTLCSVVIDGEKFSNVGIRAKGNNSLRLTHKYGLDRYSLKLEFDHYEFRSYHGLDKFSLDSSFQDNSYMKTWVCFDMMEHMGCLLYTSRCV